MKKVDEFKSLIMDIECSDDWIAKFKKMRNNIFYQNVKGHSSDENKHVYSTDIRKFPDLLRFGRIICQTITLMQMHLHFF